MSGNRPGGTITIAGKQVARLGFGTMRLTGSGTWGTPADQTTALRLLRTCVAEFGINHIDTADAYGPHTVEELIRWALHPYDDDLLLATKVGMVRPAPNIWSPLGRPDYLRAAVEGSLRRLATERLDLCYLHRIDPTVPLADQVAVLDALREEGKIGAIGLSKVTPRQIAEASTFVPIAAVQNVLNIDEPDDPAVAYCAQHGIPYIPYRPLNAGRHAGDSAGKALRWLLDLGEHVAPIPGTSNPEHLAALVAAVTADHPESEQR
ncbi:aldo/keto reductase [Kitasatospora atroaurantiaca]|uniref:Aryl-alcohol dehydrogenase-like predicted oxidoreductase n=1 Tax=Kitasatospora atroaurantiaca TaxID=285545 RepID=A0A561EMX8_9ACTN|nr:aldo/keto reductase [Kitasatospora atroaurantiaca]TWE16978.1 aryl-alcohol dehydrogenase-like predicted oxidoreductase [Kitasatospora atroaurantiaca]